MNIRIVKNKMKQLMSCLLAMVMVCTSVITYLPSVDVNAAASTISGTCTIKCTKNRWDDGSTEFAVTLKGKTYTGYCLDSTYPTPKDGEYDYEGTLFRKWSFQFILNVLY